MKGDDIMDFEYASTKEECRKIQLELTKKLILKSNFDLKDIKYVAGVDLAYWNDGKGEKAVCCIVVIDFETKKILETVDFMDYVNFPYIAGCLAFREIPLFLKALRKLRYSPDLYVFDGNGYLHPCNMGIASHASFYVNRPTIGVAKKYFKIDNVDFVMPDNIKGAYTDIIINNKIYGRALRTHKDVKPIFISVGNFIDINMSTEIIKSLINKESHIPIPTRLADLETHKMRDIYK